jgi:hypothetical protein
LQRDEFKKALKLVLRNLPPKIKCAGYIQFGLLITLMLMAIAYRHGGEMGPVSLIIFILVWLVFLTAQIARRVWVELQFAPMEGTVPSPDS